MDEVGIGFVVGYGVLGCYVLCMVLWCVWVG